MILFCKAFMYEQAEDKVQSSIIYNYLILPHFLPPSFLSFLLSFRFP